MKELVFRLLKAKEIECRVGAGGNDKTRTWCTLLLYKDARVDQKLLDEVVGAFGWKRTHREIGGRLYCEVSIYNEETKEWVSKEDVGTESNTEKEKGQASDAFKRACFNWGIGRELYTAPLIYISLTDDDFKNGRLNTRFLVSKIEFSKDREISDLEIIDNHGNVRFSMNKKASSTKKKVAEKKPAEPKPEAPKYSKETLDEALAKIKGTNTKTGLNNIYYEFANLQGVTEFISALSARKKEIS